jgi:hypothetical protein
MVGVSRMDCASLSSGGWIGTSFRLSSPGLWPVTPTID